MTHEMQIEIAVNAARARAEVPMKAAYAALMEVGGYRARIEAIDREDPGLVSRRHDGVDVGRPYVCVSVGVAGMLSDSGLVIEAPMRAPADADDLFTDGTRLLRRVRELVERDAARTAVSVRQWNAAVTDESEKVSR